MTDSDTTGQNEGKRHVSPPPEPKAGADAARLRALMRTNLLYNPYLRALRAQSLCRSVRNP